MPCDTPLCASSLVANGQARGIVAAGKSLLLVNKAGRLFLYHNRCPHRGVELNWLPDQFLDVDGELIQCSTHGALFLVPSGLCVAGPCHGEYLQAEPFEIRDGCIFIGTTMPGQE
jgi:nitrite reductase/ring-hydroxylating ferredoxin subunit